jgi:hypothetical protein
MASYQPVAADSHPPDADPSEQTGQRDPAWQRALRGAVAGCAGTAVMSVIQFAGADVASRHAPPIETTKQLHKLLGARTPHGSALYTRGMLMHLAFGAAAGALYGLVAPRRYREVSGVGYALAVYGVSYFGVLPALSLHEHAIEDDAPRQIANLVAHLVYGTSLAEVMRLTDPRA